MFSDQTRWIGANLATRLVSPAEPALEMFGDNEHGRSGTLQRRNETLDRQTLKDRQRIGPGEPGDGAHVVWAQPALATGEGKGLGFGLIQMNTEACLEQNLLPGQELLVDESEPKYLARPVAVDDRRNVPQPSPVAENGANAGPGLLTQADPAEGGNNLGVADLLLAGSRSSSADAKASPGFQYSARSSKKRIVGVRAWSA